MIAYVVTFLCLLMELAMLPIRYLLFGTGTGRGSSSSKTTKIPPELLKDDSATDLDSTCHSNSTSSSTSGSSAGLKQEEDNIQRNRSSSSSSGSNDFVRHEISQALQQQGRQRTLTFHNFVERSTDARDALALGEELIGLLQKQQKQGWRSIHFEDIVDATIYRRWSFKRTGLYRHILAKLANNNGADGAAAAAFQITFAATLVIDTDTLTVPAIVSLLKELQKDHDIKNLIFKGTLHHHQDVETIALALVSLLQNNNNNNNHDKKNKNTSTRIWQSIQWQIQIATNQTATPSREAQLVHKVCQRALHKVAKERYITIQF